jgi:MscS family membrane protein
LRLVLHRTYLAFISIVITWIALRFVSFLGLLLYARAELTDSKSDDQLVPFVTEILKIIVIIFGIFFLMGAVFKIDIAALVAGLGIGGLALALAAKESLENLLASFTIFFDKPFMIGDLITVNGYTGTVEKIGFRSTRIRTLEKSYLTIPNLQMVNDVLDNLSLRTFRRVSFNIGLTYETSETQIKSIVLEIQSFIDQHPNTNQEGEIHFMDFSSSSLDIMVLYFIDTMDYRQYLIIKEEINYEIMRIVKANNASFAFPTQTIQITKN